MSELKSLHQRGAALENQFFANLDARLLEELKTKQEHENAVAEFGHVTGIQDTAVVESILKLGVDSKTIAALRVFPLVAVAWADGRLDESERLAVNTIASTYLMLRDCPAGMLLESWLTTKPTDEMFSAWEQYARSLASSLTLHEADALKKTLINELQTVASSSGGLLGIASISPSESETIRRIEAALTRE